MTILCKQQLTSKFFKNLQVYKANSLASLEKWLNRTEKDFNGNVISNLKVVGFFYDPEETAEDREEFVEAMERSMDKTEVYFAIVRKLLYN